MITFGRSEERDFLENHNINKFTMRDISYDEFSKNNGAMRTFSAIRDKQEARKNSRVIYDPINDFYIETNNVTVAEKDGQFYYTFLISRDSISSKTENLVLKGDGNGEFIPLIFEYLLSESDKANIINGQPVENISDKTVIKKPEEIGLEGIVESAGKYTVCVKVYVPTCSFVNHSESTGFHNCLGLDYEWHLEKSF